MKSVVISYLHRLRPVMRTDYTLEGNNETVADSDVNEAKNYTLPKANYIYFPPFIPEERRLQRDVDNTYRKPYIRFPRVEPIDTRKQRL